MRLALALLVALAVLPSTAGATMLWSRGGSGGSSFVPDPTSCSAGAFISGLDTDGTVTCGTPSAGSAAFDTITTGSNTTATMTCGSGCSVVPAGTGVVEATAVETSAGALTCGVGNAGKILSVPGPLQYCDNAATPTLRRAAFGGTSGEAQNLGCTDCVALGTETSGSYAAGDAEAGAALTGDSATSFFASGTVEAARLPDADDDASTKGVVTFPNAQFDCTAGSCSIATGGIGATELDTTELVDVTFGAGESTNTFSFNLAAGDVELTASEDTFTFQAINLKRTSANICDDGAVCTGYQAGPLTGDVTTSGAAATIAANSVALGTDTTGNYAAGDAEAGAATDLACASSPCVANSETTAASANTASAIVARDASGDFAAGIITANALDVQGDSNLDGHVVIAASHGTVSADHAIVTFPYEHDFEGAAADMVILGVNPTVHLGQASAFLGTYGVLSTQGMTFEHDDATSGNLPSIQVFRSNHIVNNSVSVRMPSVFTLLDDSTIRASAGATVPAAGNYRTIYARPFFSSIDASTLTVTNAFGFEWAPRLSTDNGASDGTAVTVTNMTGFKVTDVSLGAGDGTETVTTQIGVDIAALSGASTNIGIRNADTSVYTPPSTVTVSAGFTINPTATAVKIDAPSAVTSNTTTAITDGTDGQVLYIMNVDSTDAITIDDGGNTDLGGSDCVLNSGGVLHVIFSSDLSVWLEVNCSAN